MSIKFIETFYSESSISTMRSCQAADQCERKLLRWSVLDECSFNIQVENPYRVSQVEAYVISFIRVKGLPMQMALLIIGLTGPGKRAPITHHNST